ncbi:CKLF-like MARVEL transmembrane domain-containing protein 8 isoform X2 [Lethenteron reissneri]|uniref:CKLF-like MARVEL transmembrane domain-containing protein 8 isoform X2 n=1 Tax=Lethenteron reissneri TaxID=7753 RepID=UPI002AB6DFE4|nr:CKLF-like MARVEL transmembrane domain-containing protein 8 isoform X2 [Lethenteron reissneri]
MADFPDKVSTNTTSSYPAAQSSSQIALDKGFVKTIPGILMILEIVFGLLVWSLVAATNYTTVPPLGWVLFVAVFFWLLTVFFFVVDLFALYTRAQNINWLLVGLVFNAFASVLYFSAAIVEATIASSWTRDGLDMYGHHIAATGFGYNLAAAVIYLTAAIADAASSNIYEGFERSHLVASTFFAFVVTLLYGGSCFCDFRAWQGTHAPHAPSNPGDVQRAVHATNVAIVQIQAVEFHTANTDARVPTDAQVNIYNQ